MSGRFGEKSRFIGAFGAVAGRFGLGEGFLYIAFGVLTTAVAYGGYAFFSRVAGLDYIWASVLSWVAAVLFAFFTNRRYVFKSTLSSDLGRELFLFFALRLATLGLDVALMWAQVDVLGINDLIAKIVSNVFVMVANFFASKFWVFGKRK